jgi:hypothetical protein|nr:hypothetical protein [Neorhizobium tomejilense]
MIDIFAEELHTRRVQALQLRYVTFASGSARSRRAGAFMPRRLDPNAVFRCSNQRNNGSRQTSARIGLEPEFSAMGAHRFPEVW